MIKYTNAIYSGEEQNGEPNGYGELKYHNGDRFVGHFSNGQLDGSGTRYYNNGMIIEGDFSMGVITRGKAKYTTGNIFTGSFKDSYPYEGIMEYTNGDKFEGFFDLNRDYKKGTYYFKDGSKYVGELIDGLKHGKGIEYIKDYVYDGTYDNDNKEGIFDVTKGGMHVSATYHNNLLNGYCKIEENGNVYEGNYVDDLEDGRWKITKNGKTFYVTFSHGKVIDSPKDVKIDFKKFANTNSVNVTKTISPVYVVYFNEHKQNEIDKDIVKELEENIKKNQVLKNELLKIEKYANDNFKDSDIFHDWEMKMYEYQSMDVEITTKSKSKMLANGAIMFGPYRSGLFKKNSLINGMCSYDTKTDHYVGKFENTLINGCGYHYKSNKDDLSDVYFGEYKYGQEYGNGIRFGKTFNIFGNFIDGKYVGTAKIEYSNGNIYIGQANKKGPSGKGVVYYPNKNKYMCNFKNGKPYKEYMQIYSDGNYDISYLNENGKLEGLYTRYNKANQLLCAYTYVNGVLTGPAKIIENGKYVYKVYYLGEEANLYKNDEFEFYGSLDKNGYASKGRVKLPNGNIYIGDFDKGKLTGKNSKIYYSNGDVFIGEVKDGNPVNGTMEYKKPYQEFFVKYVGPFKDGIPASFGRFYYKESDMWYEGPIVNGMPNGYGTLHANGKDTKYHFVNGLI